MFFLILIMWVILVFCLKVAVSGNPLSKLVKKQDPALLAGLDKRMQNRMIPTDLSGPEAEFVRRFSRLAILEITLFVVEVAILVVLVFSWRFDQPVYWWLCVGLLGKNIIAFLISWIYSRTLREEQGFFRHLLQLPVWIELIDRLSAVLSATVFILLILKISGIWPGNGV